MYGDHQNKPRIAVDRLCTENGIVPGCVVRSAWLTKLCLPFYNFRYWVVRNFFCPMKCSYLNFLGPELSLIQLLVMALALSIICALLCTLRKGVGESGSNCQTIGVIVVILGLRNNLNTIFFGISFERAIYFHKFAGMLFILSTAWHGYYALQRSTPSNFASDTYHLTGVILAFLVGGIGITYLVKNKNFELFYYLHMLMYCATIPVAYLHHAPIYALSCIAWAIDLTLRYVLARKSAVAVIDLLPADVIRITVPKPFEYTAGQYCFIMIPQLSWLEFHPFSISTSPFDRNVRFHIRALGDWTNSLKKLLEERAAGSQFNETNQSIVNDQISDTSSTPDVRDPKPISRMVLPINIEGPYGLPSIDLFGAEYEVLLFVSAGIGVTPCQSVFNHIIHQHALNKRKLRKVIFIWTVRDRFMIESVTKTHLKSMTANAIEESRHSIQVNEQSSHNNEELPTSFQPNMLNFSNKVALTEAAIKAHIEQQQGIKKPYSTSMSDPIMDAHKDDLSDISIEQPSVQSILKPKFSFSYGEDEKAKNDVFHVEFYLTQARKDTKDQAAANIFPDAQGKYLHLGRPDLPKIFKDITELCSHENNRTYNNNYIDRVAVMTCGPPGIVEEITSLCKQNYFTKNPEGQDAKVKFDLHAEVFDF